MMNFHRDMSIGEVSTLTGVGLQTLRHWEREFSEFLQPTRTQGGHRRYVSDNIAMVLEIRQLIRDKMYTTAGAKQALREKYDNGQSRRTE
jgi:DNA-binding transcriptional MerR regulator